MKGASSGHGDTGAGADAAYGKDRYNPGAGDRTIVAGKGHWWRMP